MTTTYASSRLKLPDTAFSVAAIAGSTSAPQNLNVYLSAENRVGMNRLSNPKAIALTSGQGLEVTINADAIVAGEDPFWLVVSIETTGLATDAVRVAAFKVKEDDQILRRSLLATINLITDEHFNSTRTVADIDSLPTTGIVDGAIALVAQTGIYYRYDSEAYVRGDRLISYGTFVEGNGNWIRYNGLFSSYVDSTTAITNGLSGSDRPLKTIDNALTIPPKEEVDIESTPIIYWINNGFAADGGSPIINGRYSFKVEIDGQDYSGVFAQKIRYTLLGYFDRDTGVLDTSLDSVGELKIWTPTQQIKLPADLPRNHAAVYEVYFNYSANELNNKLPDSYNYLELNIFEFGNSSGVLDSSANDFGDIVFNDRGSLLIVPGAKRLSGIGKIKMPNSIGYGIDQINEQPIVGLLADTADQVAAMSGAINGFITIRQQGESLAYSEKPRAYISTAAGLSNLTSSTNQLSLTNQSIKITITHPVNSSGNGIVRANYSDRYLAGNEQGQFTPTTGYIFLEIDGILYQSSLKSVVATGAQPQQEFVITDLGDYVAIASLPVQSDPAFCLFEPSNVDLQLEGAGSITGLVTPYWAYSYESPNLKATKIRHDLPGTIPTLTLTIGEISSQLSTVVEHLTDINNPHNTTREQLGAAAQADLDITNQNVSDNDSDITNLTQNLSTTNNRVTTNEQAIALNTSFRDNAGNAVTKDAGTAIGDLVELSDNNGTASLPAVDGSRLTGVSGQLTVEFVSGTIAAVVSPTAPVNYLVDTSSAIATINLPDTVADKGIVAFSDRADSFGTNNATINPGTSHTIRGNANFLLDFDGEAVTLVFDAANNNYVVLDGIQNTSTGSGDMSKSVYDSDDDGIVDESEAIAGISVAGANKFYGTDGTGTPGFIDYLIGSAVKDALEAIVDDSLKLSLGAIAKSRAIANDPIDDYCLTYDLTSDSILYRPRIQQPGAGAILIPLSQSLFEITDGALSTYSPDIGTAVYEDIKILTTAGTPNNQIVNEQLVINTINTGAVLDLGVSDTVITTDWIFTTGDIGCIILRADSDGNLNYLELSENAIALKSVAGDIVSTVATNAYSFISGTTYRIEVVVIGVTYKVSIDSSVAIAEILSNEFKNATKFGVGKIN